jgi:aryl-alcohol dehydrogenase-like predicted oxidoreductase
MSTTKVLNEYRLLGRTGLRISPLSLGAMTFGWGADKETSRQIFQTYLDAGGNFIDTADAYGNGTSEEWVGDFIQETKSRDQIVLATKFTLNMQSGNPNAGGNGRKNIYRAVDASLKRLKTDYLDLYWMHAWDQVTPAEEVMSTLNDLVRQGKVRHIGLSDVPAWYAAHAQGIAENEGYEKISALQLEYSLISRGLEREHRPMARELGLSLIPWSPLASGFLTGKFTRDAEGVKGEGRVQEVKNSGNPVMEKFTKSERNWKILETLREVAAEMEQSPATVALNWVFTQPGVTSTLIGSTKVAQMEQNFRALEIKIPQPLREKLNQASRLEENELDHFFSEFMFNWINGGVRVVS